MVGVAADVYCLVTRMRVWPIVALAGTISRLLAWIASTPVELVMVPTRLPSSESNVPLLFQSTYTAIADL